MRTPGRITTVITAGVLATAATGAVAVAGQSGTCDGTRTGAGPGTGQAQSVTQQKQQRRANRRAAQGQRTGQRAMRGSRGAQRRAQRLPARTNAAPLSTAEAAAVTYMREEEKLARDVYTKLAAQWNDPVFARIAVSEQRHMDAMGQLITRYKLADPAKGKAAGEFTNPELQQLYDELVAKGGASQAAAIQVGVAIEKLDIADLEERLAVSEHRDLTQVLQNLERGSQNHLRAFTAHAG